MFLNTRILKEKPDWNIWKHRPTATITELSYLSLGYDPNIHVELMSNYSRIKNNSRLKTSETFKVASSILERQETLIRNLPENGGELPVFEARHFEQEKGETLIKIDRFVAWANIEGIEISDEFAPIPDDLALFPISTKNTELQDAPEPVEQLSKPLPPIIEELTKGKGGIGLFGVDAIKIHWQSCSANPNNTEELRKWIIQNRAKLPSYTIQGDTMKAGLKINNTKYTKQQLEQSWDEMIKKIQ